MSDQEADNDINIVYEGIIQKLRQSLEILERIELTTQTFRDYHTRLMAALNQNDTIVAEKNRSCMAIEQRLARNLEKADKSKQDTVGNVWYDTTQDALEYIRFVKDMLDWYNLEFEFMKSAIEKFIARIQQVNAIENEKQVMTAKIQLMELENKHKIDQMAHDLEMEKLKVQERMGVQPQAKPISPPGKSVPPVEEADDGLEEGEEEADDTASEDSEEEEDDSQPEPKKRAGRPKKDAKEWLVDPEKEPAKKKEKKILVRGRKARELAEPPPTKEKDLTDFVHRKMLKGFGKIKLQKSFKIPHSKMNKIIQTLLAEGKVKKKNIPGRKPPLDFKWVAVEVDKNATRSKG